MTQRHFPILKQSPPQTGQFKKKNYLATAAQHHGCPDTWCPRKFSAAAPPPPPPAGRAWVLLYRFPS